MPNLGVVACETLYADIAAIRPDATVRYVPQEFHEFPASGPQDSAIRERVQTHVDALEEAECDRIVVIYARSSDGLAGVRTNHTPLVVSEALDCVSLFLPDAAPRRSGDPKASGTYYLTRGWIDCGVDCYKLHEAYRGAGEALHAAFDGIGAERRVTWHEGERFRQAVDRGRRMSTASIGRFFHEIVGYYDEVSLVDTGLLTPFDHEYAGMVRDFVESLRREHGDGGTVDRSVVDGTRGRLRAVLDVEPDPAVAQRYAPGTAIE